MSLNGPGAGVSAVCLLELVAVLQMRPLPPEPIACIFGARGATAPLTGVAPVTPVTDG